MREKKLGYLIWNIFCLIGLGHFIIGVIVCAFMLNYTNKTDAVGIITNISSYRDANGNRKNEVYVSYDVNGKKYESILHAYSSTFYEGKEIKIYYDNNNPNRIGMKGLNLLFLMFPGFGLIFLIIGGIGVTVKKVSERNEKKLIENGDIIYADYIRTTRNTMYTVNRKCPYNIICEWNNPEDGKRYFFRSKDVWINPETIIKERNITKFAVHIDRDNKKKYVVDVDSLTQDIVDLT